MDSKHKKHAVCFFVARKKDNGCVWSVSTGNPTILHFGWDVQVTFASLAYFLQLIVFFSLPYIQTVRPSMNHRHRHEKLRISVKVPSIELMNQLHARALPWTWLVLMEMLGWTGFIYFATALLHTHGKGLDSQPLAIDGNYHDLICNPIWNNAISGMR